LIEPPVEVLVDFFRLGIRPNFAAADFADSVCLGFAATLPQAAKALFLETGFGFLGGLRVLFGMIVYT
jgi:hypothetical protein